MTNAEFREMLEDRTAKYAVEWGDRKLVDLGGHGLPGKWYNTRHRYGGKENRKQQDEVFGCIPHGRGAFWNLPR